MSKKLKVLRYFIKSSPVAELESLLNDIAQITGSKDFLQTGDLHEAIREYHERHLTHHTLPDGTKVLLTPTGRCEDQLVYKQQQQPEEEEGAEEIPDENEEKEIEKRAFVYVDQARNCQFSYDPLTGKAELLNDNMRSQDEQVQELKEHFVEALDYYIDVDYRKEKTLTTIAIDESESPNLRIIVDISAHNVDFHNFSVGAWVSSWEISHTLGQQNYSIKGELTLSSHYFEFGNVQFKISKTFEEESENAVSSSFKDVSKAVIRKIKKKEDDYQENGLEQMYTDIKERYIKALRRKLPITGSRFDWTSPKHI